MPFAVHSQPQFSGIYRFRSWQQVKSLLFESGHFTYRWKASRLQAIRNTLTKAGLESELLQPFGWLHPNGTKQFVFATNDHYGRHADTWQTLSTTDAIQLLKNETQWGHNPDGWLELPKAEAPIQALVVTPVNRFWHWLKSIWLQIFPSK